MAQGTATKRRVRPQGSARAKSPARTEGPPKQKAKRRFRALVPLNVGRGQRLAGELVPEAHDWDPETRKSAVKQERIEEDVTSEEPGPLHEWIDPDRPQLGTKDDDEAVAAYEQMKETAAAQGVDIDAKEEVVGPPKNTHEALIRAEERRQALVDADYEAGERERRAEEEKALTGSA